MLQQSLLVTDGWSQSDIYDSSVERVLEWDQPWVTNDGPQLAWLFSSTDDNKHLFSYYLFVQVLNTVLHLYTEVYTVKQVL
jgi:hypothetical protein